MATLFLCLRTRVHIPRGVRAIIFNYIDFDDLLWHYYNERNSCLGTRLPEILFSKYVYSNTAKDVFKYDNLELFKQHNMREISIKIFDRIYHYPRIINYIRETKLQVGKILQKVLDLLDDDDFRDARACAYRLVYGRVTINNILYDQPYFNNNMMHYMDNAKILWENRSSTYIINLHVSSAVI